MLSIHMARQDRQDSATPITAQQMHEQASATAAYFSGQAQIRQAELNAAKAEGAAEARTEDAKKAADKKRENDERRLERRRQNARKREENKRRKAEKRSQKDAAKAAERARQDGLLDMDHDRIQHMGAQDEFTRAAARFTKAGDVEGAARMTTQAAVAGERAAATRRRITDTAAQSTNADVRAHFNGPRNATTVGEIDPIEVAAMRPVVKPTKRPNRFARALGAIFQNK